LCEVSVVQTDNHGVRRDDATVMVEYLWTEWRKRRFQNSVIHLRFLRQQSGSGCGVSRNEGRRAFRRRLRGQISICPHCNEPTYLSADGRQVPGPAFGGTVAHISSEDVSALYDEARNCMKVNAFTAAVMCCRKLLMHIAVSEGAEENKSFA
jgi:hypothetical protein